MEVIIKIFAYLIHWYIFVLFSVQIYFQFFNKRTYENKTRIVLLIYLVAAPAAPTLTSTIPQTTTISLTWTQPPGDVVYSYTISYNSTIYQCEGSLEFISSGSIPGINGSMRSYNLINLEEDSVYNISIEAVNKAGSASSTILMRRTSGAGMLHLNTRNFEFVLVFEVTLGMM